jgi:hypothetical protein
VLTERRRHVFSAGSIFHLHSFDNKELTFILAAKGERRGPRSDSQASDLGQGSDDQYQTTASSVGRSNAATIIYVSCPDRLLWLSSRPVTLIGYGGGMFRE